MPFSMFNKLISVLSDLYSIRDEHAWSECEQTGFMFLSTDSA